MRTEANRRWGSAAPGGPTSGPEPRRGARRPDPALRRDRIANGGEAAGRARPVGGPS